MLSSLLRSSVCLLSACLATVAQVQETPYQLRVSYHADYQTRSWSGEGWNLDYDTGEHNTTWNGWSLASTVFTPASGSSYLERSSEWSDDNYNGSYESCSGWNYLSWENTWADGPGTPGWLSWVSWYEACDQPFTEAYDGEEIEPYEMPEAPWILMHWDTNFTTMWANEEPPEVGTQEVEDNRHVTTRVELRTGGTTVDGNNVGGQSLWMITVSATAKHLGDTPVPPTSIEVLGQTPDANGRIFILLDDHSTREVTPKIAEPQDGTITSTSFM
ncbi:MAG: hypothetical protein HC801_10810 [Nitrospira sp.]|nr:hypothetical protein [Nitrospira sp.]